MRPRFSALFVPLVVCGSLSPAAAADSVCRFTLPSGVEITIIEAPLRGNIHPRCNRAGKPLVFTDDNRPRTYVKSILGRYEGHRFRLESTCMSDAWNGRPLEHPGSIRYFGGRCSVGGGTLYCTLRGIFADASESFAAEWYVVGSFGHRSVNSGSHDVINLFMENIDGEEE